MFAMMAMMLLTVASCGSKRKAVKDTPKAVFNADTLKKQAFLQQVTDNAQHARR